MHLELDVHKVHIGVMVRWPPNTRQIVHGTTLKNKLPEALIQVVNAQLFGANSTCQKPDLAFKTRNHSTVWMTIPLMVEHVVLDTHLQSTCILICPFAFGITTMPAHHVVALSTGEMSFRCSLKKDYVEHLLGLIYPGCTLQSVSSIA